MQSAYRSLRLAAAAAAIQLAVVGCVQDSTPEEYVRKAQTHLDKGDLQSASVEVANALKQDQNMVEARWLMAQIALQRGNGARAEKDLRHAIQFGLPRATAQLPLVRAILLQGALDRALAETSIIPNDANSIDKAMLLGLRGQALILKGDVDEALLVLEEALQVDANATTALVGMGVAHIARREFEQARPFISRAIDADATSAEAWSTLGELELAQGNPGKAESAYDNAVKFRKHPSLDRARRALARVQQKKFAEAEADIQALQGQGWKSQPYVNYVAGLIHFHQARYREAGAAFDASHSADPSFLPSRMYLATTKFLQGQTEQALAHAQSLYMTAPRSSAARNLLGAIHINRSEYSSARGMLESALRSSPDDHGALRMLATVSLLEGDNTKGIEYARKFAALAPDSAEAQHMLMTAKLVAGQEFDTAGSPQHAATTDDYTRALLTALNDFRQGRIMAALDQAKKLHEQYPDKTDPLNLSAASHLAGGNWNLAREELAKVLALEPNQPSAARNLAMLEIRDGNMARAKALLEGSLREHPGEEQAALMLSDMLAESADVAGSIAVLDAVVKSNPNALVAHEKLSGLQLNAGNIGRVLELTNGRSDSQLQARPGLLELRGKAQMLSGDTSSARATFEKWTMLAPDSAAAHFLLSDTLARRGDTAGARKELQRAIQLDRQYLPARVGEVKMLVQSGKIQEAQKALAKLKPDFGERPEVLGIQGWFALGTGNPVTAEEHFTAALKNRPNAELTILLARSLWLQKKHDPGFEVLQSWLNDHPRDLAVLMELAGGYLALERTDEAIASYAKVLEIYPNHVPALNNIAWLSRTKAPEKAMEYAQRAQNLAPSDPYVLDTLAMLALKSGNVARAHNLIREAAQRAPENAEIQLHLGTILIEADRHNEARDVLAALARKSAGSERGKEAERLLKTFETTGQ